jgi:hypothetical protein
MEEIEVPIDDAQENTLKSAEESGVHWVTYVALSSAILAVFAAVTALESGHHVNEAMINQIKSSDKWSFYQAKGIKAAILDSRIQVLAELGKSGDQKQSEKLAEYKKQQEQISHEAEEFQAESNMHLNLHEILARAVTMFQVAIAVGAVSALTRKKIFWYVSLAFGFMGSIIFIQSLIH